MESRPVDAVETIKGMTSILGRTLGEQIELVDSLPDSLPLTVLDTAQLESAILNLAINAPPSMPGRGVCGLSAAVVAGDVLRSPRCGAGPTGPLSRQPSATARLAALATSTAATFTIAK